MFDEIDIHVILSKSRLPTREQWQQAITEFGFALRLDGDFDPTKSSALMRCSYQGNATELRYALALLEPAWLEQAAIKSAGDRDSRVTLTSSGFLDMAGWMSVIEAASVLCAISGGILIYDSGDDVHVVEADQAMDYARYEVEDLQTVMEALANSSHTRA
ncbi:MAG TPA: hypothetical protein VIU46_03415 [Gallionellaceae bacterium]